MLHIPHDFVVKLWQEARNQSAWKTEGSLGGIRKSVYNRLRYLLDSRDGPLYQPGNEARLAVEALYKYHLTDTGRTALSACEGKASVTRRSWRRRLICTMKANWSSIA